MKWGGTLTGTGLVTGSIDLWGLKDKPFFQVGDGANDKDIDFGGSGWMDYESKGLKYEYEYVKDGKTKTKKLKIKGFESGKKYHGDVNIDLEFKSSSTVPDGGGTAALLGLSILGMALAKRTKRGE